MKPVRHIVTQQQINDILDNELKDYVFPVKPIYNSQIKNNGQTVAIVNSLGQTVRIKAIEIGKQDMPDRIFLIDTLLHEYFEAEILLKQNIEPKYKKLHMSDDDKRHSWINKQISDYFKRREK